MIEQKNGKFEMPALPYAGADLAPALSAETIEFHYGKHLQTYLNNLNAALPGSAFEGKSLEEIVKTSEGGVFNNAGQFLNHSMYFLQFAAPKADNAPTGKIAEAIGVGHGGSRLGCDALGAACVAAVAPAAGGRGCGLGRRALGRRGWRRVGRGRHDVPSASPAAARGRARQGGGGGGLGLGGCVATSRWRSERTTRKPPAPRLGDEPKPGPATSPSGRPPLPRGSGFDRRFTPRRESRRREWAGPLGSLRSGRAG